MISLTIQKPTQRRGKGLWKFKNALLENTDFTNMIETEIGLIKATYALPVYSDEYVKSINVEILKLMISNTLFLETLFCHLRGQMNKFPKNLKKKEKKEENTLINEIKMLRQCIDSDNNNFSNQNSLRELSLKLENL